MDVEIRHLRAFIEVVHSGSITAAARRLRIGQPALSRTLTQLESRLRVRLVDRGPRGLTLTPAGRRFLPEAQAAVAQFDEAVASVGADEVHATLGFSWLLPPWLPVDLEPWLCDHQPALTLRVRRTERPLEELRTGRLHAAVHRLPVVADDLVAIPVGREPRVLTIACGSRFAAAVDASWDELARFPVVLNRANGTTTPDLWRSRPKEAVSCVDFDEVARVRRGRPRHRHRAGARRGVGPSSGRHLSPDQGRARGHGLVGHPRSGPPPGRDSARRLGGAALAARASAGVNSLRAQPVSLVPGSGSVRPLAPPTASAPSYHSISTSIFTFVPALF